MPRALNPITSASGSAASSPSCRLACSVVGSSTVVVGSVFGSAPRCSAIRVVNSDSPRVATSLIARMNSSKAAPKRPGSGRSVTCRLGGAEQQQPAAGEQEERASERLEVVTGLRVRARVVVELADHAGLVDVGQVADQRDQQ